MLYERREKRGFFTKEGRRIPSPLEIAFRLFLAVVLGGLIGFERESHNRPAGFRTHILVCIGAALMMMVSAYGFTSHVASGFEADPGRIAAGVATGIGFLGAGTIFQQRGSIHGLTTAASIWIVSGVGLAVGVGFYLGAVLATGFSLVSLLVLRRTDKSFFIRHRLKFLRIRAIDLPGLLGQVSTILGTFMVSVRRSEASDPHKEESGVDIITLEFLLQIPIGLDLPALFDALYKLEGVLNLYWDNQHVPK